jgi:hypothetical protein
MRAVILLGVLLTGCATPYQPKGFKGGYSDFVVRDGVYGITVNGNGYTGRDTLMQYWHRRARELCGGDYDFQSDTSTDTTVTAQNGQLNTTNRHTVSGYASCRN